MAVKPGDYTGAQRQKLAKENEEELAQRAQQMSMMQSIQIESDELDAFDPTTGKSLGRAESLRVDSPGDTAIIRVVETIDQMTFGAGNTYSFETGKQYTVPMDLAEYLDGLGYVWGGVQKVPASRSK